MSHGGVLHESVGHSSLASSTIRKCQGKIRPGLGRGHAPGLSSEHGRDHAPRPPLVYRGRMCWELVEPG
jgi:hypothetical protein